MEMIQRYTTTTDLDTIVDYGIHHPQSSISIVDEAVHRQNLH
jgi:hypothetical protein